MNVEDTAYETVRSYPGGSASLAPRMGMSQALLNSKVNPNTRTHHLTLMEAFKLVDLTDDERILHAWAAERGRAVVPTESDASLDILSAALNAEAAKGNLSRLLHDALADGKVTANEAKGLMAAGADAQAAVVKLLASAQAMVPKPTEVA